MVNTLYYQFYYYCNTILYDVFRLSGSSLALQSKRSQIDAKMLPVKCVYSCISLLRCMCISKRHESLSSMYKQKPLCKLGGRRRFVYR